MRCRSGNPARKAATSAAIASRLPTTATTVVTTWISTRKVARNNDGSVTMSPAAVTSGAATLSMSHPRRTEPAATPRVRARTAADEMTPPMIEMTTKSPMEMVL